MNTKELNDSLDALPYPSTGSKEERIAARQVYYEQKAELEKQWQEWLHKNYAPGFPLELHQHVFSKAWEDGHSCSYGEVEFHYEDLTEFVTKAISIHRRA